MSSQKTATIRLNQGNDAKGYTVIDSASATTRLNYFDGKFLRAPDLQLEQNALLNQVRIANQAGGGGVVHGFNCSLAGGDNLLIGAGLAFDWQGRALMLGQDLEVAISDLINDASLVSAASLSKNVRETARDRGAFKDCEIRGKSPTPDNILANDELYLVVISHIEAYCGEEDVYGKLCSEACISDTQRTHIVEGINISLVPLTLSESLKTSEQVTLTQKHLRSRTVSAYFAQEKSRISSLISQQGLSANTWCMGAEGMSGQGIAIGMLSKLSNSVVFLDAWSARRERMDAPPKQYWAGRMGMRSWHIYLAQILQFQCQLRDCLGGFDPENPPVTGDPCAEEKALIQTAASDMKQLLSHYTNVSAKLTQIDRVPQGNIATLDVNALRASIDRLQAVGIGRISQQLLIDCGIVELPSAGYLPVVADSDMSINAQVRQLMGNGVNLRFCAVRPDYVHHALEEAQHMDRICLLTGLDDEDNRQNVDILVPEGLINQKETEQSLDGFQASLDSTDTMLGMMLHLAGSKFRDSLDKSSLRDELVLRNAENARAVNVSEVSVSAGKLQFGENMTGSARADTDGQNKAFYLATSNASSNVIDNLKVKTDINFWGQMQSNKNVFESTKNDRVQLSSRFLMEATLQYESDKQTIKIDIIIELNINGQLIIEDILQRGAAKRMEGRFIGDCIMQYTTVQDGTPKSQVSSSSLNDDIFLTKTVSDKGSDISIQIPSPSLFGNSDLVDMVYKQSWNAAGECEVQGILSLRTDNEVREQNFLSGKFIPNNDALKAGNQFYEKSQVALNQIAGALNNSGFIETANSLLFPTPKVQPDELTVKGSYPWVLFHRRRDKNCEGSKIPEPVVANRRYQIYYVPIDQGVDTEKLVASIDRAFESAVSEANLVSEANFAANSQILNTSHQQVKQAWSNTVPRGTQIIVAAIASQGDVLTEGDQLARSRANSTTNVIDQVADVTPGLAVIVKETLPASLSGNDIDGAIVYFVQEVQVNTDCHAVYQVLSTDPEQISRQIEDAVAKYNSGATDLTFDAIFDNDMARRLAVNPKFKEGTGEFASSQQAELLKNVWIEAGDYQVTHAGALHAQENSQDAASTETQTSSILEITGFVSNDQDDNRATIAVPSGMLGDCQRASVLLSATQCHDVYLVAFAGRDDLLIAGKQVSEAERASLDVLFVEANTGWGRGQVVYYSLDSANYYWDSNQMVASSRQIFDNNWRGYLSASDSLRSAISGAPRIEFYSMTRQTIDNNGNPSSNPNADEAKDQNTALAELMNTSRPTQHFGAQTSRDGFPSNCPVVTFVVIDPAQRVTENRNDLGANVKFNDNNEVLRDEQFDKAVDNLVSVSARVDEIEILSSDAQPASLKIAETQARSVKKILQEKGVATRMTRVSARAPTRVEINKRHRISLLLKS